MTIRYTLSKYLQGVECPALWWSSQSSRKPSYLRWAGKLFSSPWPCPRHRIWWMRVATITKLATESRRLSAVLIKKSHPAEPLYARCLGSRRIELTELSSDAIVENADRNLMSVHVGLKKIIPKLTEHRNGGCVQQIGLVRRVGQQVNGVTGLSTHFFARCLLELLERRP